MSIEQTRFDHWTLHHLVAAQLASGLTEGGDTPEKAVELYARVYQILSDRGLHPTD
jgi:hypothetical protein